MFSALQSRGVFQQKKITQKILLYFMSVYDWLSQSKARTHSDQLYYTFLFFPNIFSPFSPRVSFFLCSFSLFIKLPLTFNYSTLNSEFSQLDV